jgi:hypothetical protein
MTQRLNYNVTGQTMRHVPDVYQSSVAWVLQDLLLDVDNAARTLDSGTAAVDTATEVITAAAGPGQANPRLMTMASTTDLAIGTSYQIVAPNGESEIFECSGLTTNTSILSRLPLLGSYPIGSTVRGVTCTTAAILAAVLQDELRVQADEPMRVVWTYSNGLRKQEQVRLVRENGSDLSIPAIAADLRDIFPDLDTREAHHGRDVLTPHIRTVIRQFRADALERGEVIEEWLTGEQGHWAVVWRTMLHLAMLGNVPGNVDAREFKDYCKSEYMKRWTGLTSGEGGREVLKIDPVSVTAPASDDTTYRRVIAEL